MKKLFLSISVILLMCACGGQTQKPTQENDSATASVEETDKKGATATGIPAFVTNVYNKVNEVMSQKVVNTAVLDSASANGRPAVCFGSLYLAGEVLNYYDKK
jgi:folylpolyglutamate synthase/dihydropteroate synthase